MKIELESRYNPGDIIKYFVYDEASSLQTGETKTEVKEDIIECINFNVYDDITLINFGMRNSGEIISLIQVIGGLNG